MFLDKIIGVNETPIDQLKKSLIHLFNNRMFVKLHQDTRVDYGILSIEYLNVADKLSYEIAVKKQIYKYLKQVSDVDVSLNIEINVINIRLKLIDSETTLVFIDTLYY